MNQFAQEPDLEALAHEQLSPQELREVLTRLGNAQFGGSEQADLGAVAETTRVPLVEVGRVLADVRREQLSKTLGERVDAQELALQRLELAVQRLELQRTIASRQPEIHASKASREINRFVSGLVLLLLLAAMLLMFVLTPSTVRTVAPAPPPPRIEGN